MTQELIALLLFVGMVASWVVLPTGEVGEAEAVSSTPVRQTT